MSRKRRKYETNLHPADGHFDNMKYKDLKRECVVRGMSFDDVLNSDTVRLYHYFKDNYYVPIVYSLLEICHSLNKDNSEN